MTETQNHDQTGPTKSKPSMYAVMTSRGSPELAPVVLEAKTRKDLARAIAEYPDFDLRLAVRGKRLTPKTHVSLS